MMSSTVNPPSSDRRARDRGTQQVVPHLVGAGRGEGARPEHARWTARAAGRVRDAAFINARGRVNETVIRRRPSVNKPNPPEPRCSSLSVLDPIGIDEPEPMPEAAHASSARSNVTSA